MSFHFWMEKMKPIFLPTFALPSHFECRLVFFVPFSRPESNFHISSLSALLASPPLPHFRADSSPPILPLPSDICPTYSVSPTYTIHTHILSTDVPCTLFPISPKMLLFERTPQLPFSAFSGPGLRTRLQRLMFLFHNSLGKVLEIYLLKQ